MDRLKAASARSSKFEPRWLGPVVAFLVISCARGPTTTATSEHTTGKTSAPLLSNVFGSQVDAATDENGRETKLLVDAGVTAASPFWYADLEPTNDGVVAPPEDRANCENDLTSLGAKFRKASIPVHEEGKRRKMLCGASQMVTYLGSASKVRYNGSPTFTCRMALAMAHAEVIAQEEALRIFGKPLARIDHIGTYNCREMAAYPGWVSEHSYANAIDLEKFVLGSGKEISVLRHFQKGEGEPTTQEAQFLRTFSRRLYDENVFSNVLTPYFDAHHANHFHVDLGRYRTDGTRPQ